MSNNVTETLDKLYLAWSQFTTARNAREIAMAATIADLTAALREIAEGRMYGTEMREIARAALTRAKGGQT